MSGVKVRREKSVKHSLKLSHDCSTQDTDIYSQGLYFILANHNSSVESIL